MAVVGCHRVTFIDTYIHTLCRKWKMGMETGVKIEMEIGMETGMDIGMETGIEMGIDIGMETER